MNEAQNNSEQVLQQSVVAMNQQIFVGPLPPPDVLEAYRRIDPTYPERIMQQFEAEAECGRQARINQQKAEIDRDKRGQYLAFMSIVGILMLACVAIMNKATWAGAAACFGALGLIGSTFLKVKK